MSNLPKYRTSIEDHVKLSQQLLNIGGAPLVEAPAPAPAAEPVKVAADGAVDISGLTDEELKTKLASTPAGQAMLSRWETYGCHLGNVKFAEEKQDEGLAKTAAEGIQEFLNTTLGDGGYQKVAEANAAGTDAIDAFLNASAGK